MPIYDYQCSECGHQDEVMRKASDAKTAICPACEKETFSKTLSAPSFQLSGTGWYATDFKDNGKSKSTTPKKEEKTTDKYGRTLRTPQSGLFIISTLRQYEGTFSFSGWYQGAYSTARPKEYRVETFDASEDIRVLLVDRMIEIIREQYPGEFQWKSNRLGQMVTLSADPAEHERLQQFLLGEFKRNFDQQLEQ